MTAIAINVIQLTALVIFSVLAIVYRVTHPAVHYAHARRHLGGHYRTV